MNPGSTVDLSALKDFAVFILREKLNEVTSLNLRLSKELKLPLLGLFEHLTEEELFALFYKAQEEFFQQLINGKAFEVARQSLIAWKNNELEGVPRERVEISDLVLTYSIRKQVAHQLLPEYTTDCEKLIAIIQELENFHLELERQAFQVYMEIQQEELHKSNQFLSSLVNKSVDGVMVFDTQMRVTEWNPAMEESMGVEKKDILGKPLLDFFPALQNSPVMEAFQAALSGEHVHLNNKSYIVKEGYYEANVIPLYTETQTISGAFVIIHDITNRIEAEERLKEHKEELQTANEELTEQREELLAANEELREQREELQAANEELSQQREEIEVVNEELQESLTQLEEAQEALEVTINQLEEAQSIAHLGSFEYFPESDHIIWSAEMKRIFAMDEKNFHLDYAGYLDLIHPEDQEMIQETVAKSIEEKIPYSFEHRIIRNGEIGWLLSNGRPVFSNGKIHKIQGTAMDITERKVAELKLQEEQFFIQKVTDTTPDVITVFDLEKRVNVYGNKELTSILGYTQDEIAELRADPAFLQKMVHPDDLEDGIKFLMDYRNYTGNETREIEYRVRKKSGEYIWVLARYNVFKRNAKGLPVQLIGVTRDINDRKLAEEQIKKNNFELHETNEELVRTEELLKEANNELEEQVARRTAELQRKNEQLVRINADLDNFIYTASHDLKVPIVNLEGLLILLNKKIQEKLPEKEQNLLNMMHTSIERFKKTIQDLSDVTKLQKELDEDIKESILLPEIVDDLQKDIEQLIQENEAQIDYSFEVKEVAFDRKNIRSVLYNLITNAIKYRSAERPPKVLVKSTKTQGGVLLSISDNGDGIPENQHEKIFSLFKRLHKNIEGSGMGLYIVKRIIDNNGGRIEVKSEVGKGTTFNIFLPDGKRSDHHIIG